MNSAGDSPVFDPIKTEAAAIARATFDVVVQAAIKIAQSYVPILAAPVISQVFTFLVTQFMGLIYKESEKGASFIIIDLRVNKESRDYKDAVIDLKKAIAVGKTKEEMDAEIKKFKDRLRDLISLKP